MDKLKFVRERLGALKSKKRWPELSFISGVSNRTLYNVFSSDHTPDTATIEKLHNAIKEMGARK